MTAANGKLKIFISWSGDLAKEVTLVLRDWLPEMFDGIIPWMSTVDIDAGARGLEEIARELDDTNFGIIVVTHDNQNAPWLNFEAGALSKRFGNEKTRVAPVLVDMTSPSQVTSPIKQFQGNLLNQEGIANVLQSIAKVTQADWSNIEKRFNRSWSELESLLVQAKHRCGIAPTSSKRDDGEMIEEVLTLVRTFSSQLQTIKANSSRDEMNRMMRRITAKQEVDEFGTSEDDGDYIRRWIASSEYPEVVRNAKDTFEQSWDLYDSVRRLMSKTDFLVALGSGKIHDVDIANLAEIYSMINRPVTETTLNHIILRHIAVMRQMLKDANIEDLTPEDAMDRLGEEMDPELIRLSLPSTPP